jgi:hypothetical protein
VTILRRVLARENPGRLDAVLKRLDRQRRVIKEHGERIGKHERRLANVEKTTRLLVLDFARIELQLGALEAKVERVASRRDAAPVTGTTDDVTEARNVVELVQREHEQIRARFQIITRYEERLRRVEDSLVASQDAEAEPPS